jgi:hypothetical protein
MAEFKISRIRYTWKGNWTTGTNYLPDDIVRYQGKAYTCLVQHTSSTDFYTDLEFLNSDTPPAAEPKWELMFDGFTWKGNWNTTTFYSIGDIVKYHGTTYIAVDSHTSAETQAGFATDIAANWIEYVASENWVGNWEPDTYFKVNDKVKVNGNIYKCLVSHTSQETSDLGIEPDIDLGYWQKVANSDSWLGAWSADVRYQLNDIAVYGGITYRCIEGHVSGALLELDQSKWEVLHLGISYKGDWDGSLVRYKLNDVVKFGGSLFICIENHTSAADFFDSYWNIWNPGFEFESVWLGGTTYQPGDIVRYGGYLYLSKTVNKGKTPPNEPADWALANTGFRIKGEWEAREPYIVGDLVRFGGQLYSVVEANINEPPYNGDVLNSTYWELTIPGDRWVGIWQPTRAYAVGDLITWIEKSYRCINVHVSTELLRPDLDVTFTYWELLTVGDSANRLRNVGDIKIYEDSETTNVPLGFKGSVIKSVDGKPQWSELMATEKVYYVSPDGVDSPENGTTLSSAWRTIRYACDNITGYATIFVKTGLYQEILPIRVPSFVAIVGDELRGAVVEPAPTLIDATDIPYSVIALEYIDQQIQDIVQNITVGTPYTVIPQNTSLPASTPTAGALIQDNIRTIVDIISLLSNPTIVSTNTATTDADVLKAIDILEANKEFIVAQTIGFMQNNYPSYNFNTASCARDLEKYIDAFVYDLEYPGNYKSIEAAKFYLHATDGNLNASQDMFLLRDGTGIRNMTLRGLIGTLTPNNTDPVLRRPTGGAYTTFDPGWGPDDETAWVGTRSPYVQNVTTFGTCCVGLRLNGDIHNGGNKTIVANDFTQILSDGIGVWVTKDARTEIVSVFTYYNHIGYLADFGGKIRATNGNNSYGAYGSVSEGVNPIEDPITATVNNRYYDASIASVFCSDNGVEKLLFSNAGQSYTTATINITGGGVGVNVVADEFRDGAVSEVRIVDPGDSSPAGGGSYIFTTNNAQGGNGVSITIAGSDENTPEIYETMRVFITRGKGAGQYGYIETYDDISKIALVRRESDGEPGWDHINPGTPIESLLDNTSVYAIEPRVIFSGPGSSVVSSTLPSSKNWKSVTYGDKFVAISTDVSEENIVPGNATAYSSDGIGWTSGSLPALRMWTSVTYGNGIYVAVSYGDVAATSEDGIVWELRSIPSANWESVAYGNDVFVAIASGGTSAAYSEDGITWNSATLPEGADWSSVVYGKDKFVAVAFSDSSTTQTVYSTDGETWTSGSFAGGCSSITYGNNKFVAIDGSTSGDTVFYSFDGINWTSVTLPTTQNWKSVTYGQGKFVAVANGYSFALTSDDGILWQVSPSIGVRDWNSVIFGNPGNSGKFIAVAGGTEGSNSYARILSGVTAQGRVTVVAGRISSINLWEPGSGYTSPPVLTVVDPNNTSDVSTDIRIANGVIAGPTFINRGIGYQTTSTSATITGDGFKDEYQLGKFLVVNNLSRLPSPGDNLNINGINDYTYKVTSVEYISGTAPNINAIITIIKGLNRAESPDHGTAISIRQLYSQVRITGHDLLDIGLGNFEQTNYPDTLFPNGTVPAPENELVERNGGRVFYTSTDQFGNFRVGELFAVEQATGTVTLNAEFFELQGLEELRLGGVTVGGTGVVIREFSTDSTFTADSNNIVPTQRAIKAYLTSKVSGGGADAITGGVTAGTVIVGPNRFDTTTGLAIQVPVKVNFKGGIDGSMLAMSYFVKRN